MTVGPSPGPAADVRLHDLEYRLEDGAWIVGRTATGVFVELPEQGVTLLRALEADGSLTAAKARADTVHDDDLDAAEFVADLVGLGFVAALDGEPVAGPAAASPSLPGLRQRHVRWAASRYAARAAAVVIAAGAALTLTERRRPASHWFFALHSPGLNALLGAGLFLLVVALHEFCHLAVARAAGVHARIELGTRLVYLAAQTSAPGLWAVDRRTRIRFYSAGITSDLVVYSLIAFTLAATDPGGLTRRVLQQLSLLILLGVAQQFALFMRTDVYFIVQELVRCRNLFADALAYQRFRVKVLRGDRRRIPDPLADVPERERPYVRLYAAVVLAGAAVTLGVFGLYELPILVTTLDRAVVEAWHGAGTGDVTAVGDGLAVIGAAVVFQGLYVRTFLRSHQIPFGRAASKLRARSVRSSRR